MRRRLYIWYRRTERFSRYLRERLTPVGMLVWVLFFAALIFGLNTQKSMVFQILAILFSLLTLSRLADRSFSPRLAVRRHLPKYGAVGTPLRYPVTVRNLGDRAEKGLTLRETPEDPTPSFEEWRDTPEPGEEERNRFDRLMRYYRWEWLIGKRIGATFEPTELPTLAPGETRDIELTLTPTRRGVVRLAGLRAERSDPFGIWKRGLVVPADGRLTVLPRLYPVNAPDFCGHRRYHPGGVPSAHKTGDSEEFTQVREYRPGDPLRKIHWRSTARTGMLTVKEFQNEYFARVGIILDTFLKRSFSAVLEEAVSVAASYVARGGSDDEMVDLMFVGADAYSFTGGRGVASTDRMLEILAGVEPCRDRPFDDLLRVVAERAALLCGAVVVLTGWDDRRQRLLETLDAARVEHLALLVTDNAATVPGAPPARVLEVGRIAEGLRRL
ncbi:MAG TPA: DUF58 domain-containing protein [bacterium]|nr:DUF58 domain-containing protein [bacterium]